MIFGHKREYISLKRNLEMWGKIIIAEQNTDYFMQTLNRLYKTVSGVLSDTEKRVSLPSAW